MGFDGKGEQVYFRMNREIRLCEPDVFLKDLGGWECSDPVILAQIKSHKIYRFKHPGNMPVTITKVVQEIHSLYPGLEVVSLGEMDGILEYRSKKPEKWTQAAKVILLAILLFVGAGFAIMAFHNDIGVTELFERFYLQVMGSKKPKVSSLEISYSLGIAIGILVFYNHFGRKKLTHDPTPIQVEMGKYQKDVDTVLAENGARRGENLDVS